MKRPTRIEARDRCPHCCGLLASFDLAPTKGIILRVAELFIYGVPFIKNKDYPIRLRMKLFIILYILIIQTFLICEKSQALDRQEQSVTPDSKSPVGGGVDSLYKKRYCSHIKALVNEDKSDGFESKAVANIFMSTTMECKYGKLPELSSGSLMAKYSTHKYFKTLENEFHENIKSCLNEGDNQNSELINKYYHVLNRVKLGLDEDLAKARFLEDIITSITEKDVTGKIDCSKIKFSDLRIQCESNCPKNPKLGEKFLSSYQTVYETYLDLASRYKKRADFLRETKSQRQDFNDELCLSIKAELERMILQYPLLNGDTFKKKIEENPGQFKDAILGELKASYSRVNNRITTNVRLQNCVTPNSGTCGVSEMLGSLKETPAKFLDLDSKNSEIDQFQLNQSCMTTAKLDKDEIRRLLGGLAGDAVLTFVSLTGVGALLGFSVRGELLLNLAVDSYFALPSVKYAYDACSKEFHPLPQNTNYQCSGSEKFVEELNEHSGCMKTAVLAAADGLPVLPAVARYIKMSKGLGPEPAKVEKTANTHSENPNLEKNMAPEKSQSAPEAKNSRTENIEMQSRVKSNGQASTPKLEQLKSELNQNDKIKHDASYVEPGTLSRNASDIGELKKTHSQANFTRASESESYHQLTSEHPEKYNFVTSRLNLIKNCNDKLLDKDACTSLGHLFQDIFSEKMRVLRAKNPDLIFDSKLKISEVAVPKENLKLREMVEEATLEAESEWMAVIAKNGYVNDLVAKSSSNLSVKEKEYMDDLFAKENWYTHGSSSETRILSEKAAEFASKNSHVRITDKSVAELRGSPAKKAFKEKRASEREPRSIRDRRESRWESRTNPNDHRQSSRIARWEDVEPNLNQHVSTAASRRNGFLNELAKRDKGRALKLITENNPEVGLVIKREVWEIVRKKQREEDLAELTHDLNLKIRQTHRGHFAGEGEGPNLSEDEVRQLQRIYHDLDPLSASPKIVYRTPPDASQFKENGGFSFDLSGFGARNIQNSEVALAKISSQTTDTPARNLFKEVTELDKPTTQLLEDTGAQIYSGAKDFAKKNALEIKYMNRSGDDVLLSFSRELTSKEREEFLSIISRQIPEKGSFRASWVPKGVNEDMASHVANMGESIEKSVRSQLKSSSEFISANKGLNIMVEREGSRVNLVVKMDDAFRRNYQNLSITKKRDFDLQMRKLSERLQEILKNVSDDLNRASTDEVTDSGTVRILDYKK
jgi:hypothetical protein